MLLSYELAKKLKDAGFPQRKGETNPFALIYPENQKWFQGWPMRPAPDDNPNGIHIDDTELKLLIGAYAPTLSELIEECGDDLVNIHKLGKNWLITKDLPILAHNPDTNGFSLHGLCSLNESLETAVAEFWLKLNVKDK